MHAGIMFYSSTTSMGKNKGDNEDIISMCSAGKKTSKNIRLYEREKNNVEHIKIGLYWLVL